MPRAWLKDDGHKVTQRFFDPAMAQIDKAMKLGGMWIWNSSVMGGAMQTSVN
jgi:hypothetical protein